MKKKYIIALAVCILLITPQIAKACWVYLTVEELVGQSDVILIGEVVEPLRGSIKTESANYNKWKVQVHYYVKGDINDSEVIVGTPDDRTSLHYDLNINGNQVLLFLRKDGNYYLPHSPQAVVGVAFDKDKIEQEKKISGKELLESIDITNKNIDSEEKGKIEEYLSTRDLIRNVELTVSDNGVQKNTITMGSFVLIGAVCIILLIRRKK